MLERMNAVAAMWLARIAAAVIACLALMTFADVFARYVFNSPFSFTIELTEAAMGVIVFFGLALVTHEDGHISVDIVTSRLRARRLEPLPDTVASSNSDRRSCCAVHTRAWLE